MSGPARPVAMAARILMMALAMAAVLIFPCAVHGQQVVEEISDARTQYAHALGLLRREFYDLAEPQFRLYMERYPDDALVQQSRLYLIECLRGQGKKDAMLAEIAAFKASYPANGNDETLSLLEAETLFGSEQFERSRDVFATLLGSKSEVRAEQARYFWGQCQLKLGQVEDAVEAFRQLSGKPFADEYVYRPYAVHTLAWLALQRGHYSEAVANFTRLQAGSGVPPSLVESACYRLAEALLGTGQDAEALAAYEKYIASYPNGQHGQEARRRRIELLSRRSEHARVVALINEWQQLYPQVVDRALDFIYAQSLLETGDFERAQYYFERLGNEPSVAEDVRRVARAYTINCLFMAGQFAVVDDYARAFLADYPTALERGSVLLWRARAALETGRLDDALQASKEAVGLYQNDLAQAVPANEVLVLILSRQEKWSEAAQVLRELAKKPGVPDPARLQLRAVEIAYKAKDLAQAKADGLQLLDNYPGEREHVRATKQILMRIGLETKDHDSAKRYAEELMDGAAVDEQVLLAQTLAVLHYNLGDSAQAIVVLREMLSRPGLPERNVLSMKQFLGRILLESGLQREALPVFSDLLHHPDVKVRRELLTVGLLFQLGEASEKQQDYGLAELAWQEVISRQDAVWTRRAELRLAQTLSQKGQLEQAQKKLWEMEKNIVADAVGLADYGQELYSLLAEIELSLGHQDQALLCAGKALKTAGADDVRQLTRARWVMAKILFEDEKSPSQALPYAVKCFILAEDDVYSPRAMLLATQIFLALDRRKDAMATWRELEAKYPSWAAAQRSQEYIKALLTVEGGPAAKP